MHRRSFLALGLVALAAQAAPALAQARRGWRTLLDGRSMTGWTPIGDANWTVGDGAVQADKGTGFLVSNENHDDVEIRAELWVDEPANSGIFIRCTNPMQVTASNAYEVNIFDTRPDPSYGTGAIVDVAKVSPMPKAAGKWNTIEIRAKGPHLVVRFNGQTTVDVQDSTHAHGRIALQHGAGLVKFRKVQVRPI
jgi:hypothetical protein